MTIPLIGFGEILRLVLHVWMHRYYGNEAEKFFLNSDLPIILPIMRIKNTVENVDWIFLKMADQSYLVKIILIMHK